MSNRHNEPSFDPSQDFLYDIDACLLVKMSPSVFDCDGEIISVHSPSGSRRGARLSTIFTSGGTLADALRLTEDNTEEFIGLINRSRGYFTFETGHGGILFITEFLGYGGYAVILFPEPVTAERIYKRAEDGTNLLISAIEQALLICGSSATSSHPASEIMLCAEAIAGLLDVSLRVSSNEDLIFLRPSFCSLCLFLIAFLTAEHRMAESSVTLLGGDIGSMEYCASLPIAGFDSFEKSPTLSALCKVTGTRTVATNSAGDGSTVTFSIKIELEQEDPSYSGLKIPQ